MPARSFAEWQVAIVDAVHDWGDDYAVERETWDPLGIALTKADCKTEANVIAVAREADVVITLGLETPISSHVIQGLSPCRLIARYGVGVDSIDVSAATARGILVTNAPEYCTAEVADHAVALILALARRVVGLDRFVRAGNWHGSIQFSGPVSRLSTLTLGLIGFGRIARLVARKMAGFVRTIVAHDPFVEQDLADGYGVQMVELDELLARADLISVHTPLLPTTHHLISAAQLARMKPTAYLINTSRGPVIDEIALIRALQTKRIAGAALDVVGSEPLAADSPLRTFNNVILTPHFASYSVEATQDLRTSVAQSVADVLEGYWPRHVVNPAVQPRFPLKRRA
jgi:D-3-phosphoglycerate dehydrogenase